MRKEQKEAIEMFGVRCDLTNNQIEDISIHLASTFGPLLIGSLIEHGLLVFRRRKRKKRK